MAFTKAVKGKKPVRLVLGGPSGSGKTYTALMFAKYLSEITGKPTAAIDTEFYRMSLYADKFNFDVDNFGPPFDPRKLMEIIHYAEANGYGQLIVDSATHFYSFEGGLLQIVQDAAKGKGGNQYAGWAVGTPIQNELVDVILRSPLHIIFCARAKQGYVEGEKNGRKTYEKVGMELQQRDGFEFDFDFFIMMDMDNNGRVEKGMGYVPTGTYIHKPGEETIELLLRSITENTVESDAIPSKPPVIAIPELQDSAIAKIQELGGQENEKLMVYLKEWDKTCNPKRVRDIDKLNVLVTELNGMLEEKKAQEKKATKKKTSEEKETK